MSLSFLIRFQSWARFSAIKLRAKQEIKINDILCQSLARHLQSDFVVFSITEGIGNKFWRWMMIYYYLCE